MGLVGHLLDLQLVDLSFEVALALQELLFRVGTVLAHLVDAATLLFELINLGGAVGNLGGGDSVDVVESLLQSQAQPVEIPRCESVPFDEFLESDLDVAFVQAPAIVGAGLVLAVVVAEPLAIALAGIATGQEIAAARATNRPPEREVWVEQLLLLLELRIYIVFIRK
ncbi:MAG: hypothetical protein NTY46_05455 [Candidatus Sumerlaeota bacterium]|nr:hypothetical protein [Candidatus Sumerlaeota bacterium]